MTFQADNREYKILIASSPDGIGCELWNVENHLMVIEIFRNDTLKQIEFYSAEMHISFEVVEKVMKVFEEQVGREFYQN